MTPILCPRCDVALPVAELTSGWCEACGLKLPPYVRREAPKPPRDLGRYPQVDPEDYSSNYPEHRTEILTPEEARQQWLSAGGTGWGILGFFVGAALGLGSWLAFAEQRKMTTGQIVLFLGVPGLLSGVLLGYLSVVLGRRKSWVVTSGIVLAALAHFALAGFLLFQLVRSFF